ncbi:MAG: hypothetical protein AAGA30_20575, partial [Planctomycetota bacterium]
QIVSLLVDKNLFLFQIEEDGQIFALNLEIFGPDAFELEDALNAARSYKAARQQQDVMSETGQANNYRDETCPFCKSTILLTGLPETPQVYCEYCDTLFTIDQHHESSSERYFRICQGCNMYSRPRQFAIFYFYFLFVTFGFHHDTTIRCSGCMRNSAWKMVVGNLFGLLGFPFALIQLYRSYSTKKLTGEFTGLDDANVLNRWNKIDKALDRYDEIMERVPINAGVKYNIAIGLLRKQDYANSEKMFELSLDDCANYWPAVSGLVTSLEGQGKTKQIEAVEKLWGLARSTPSPSA